jgi:serine/threonine protein kinase
MAADVPEQTSLAVFLQAAVRSGLVSAAELQAARQRLKPEQQDEAQALAEELVRCGKLSRFQAQKLLQGAGRGLILGPYEIVAPIGRGGMGAVYLARDRRNWQLVALKVLPPRLARQEHRFRERFLREMSLNLRFSHPHLCQGLDVGIQHSVYYLAMEFIPGRTLQRLVQEDGPLTVPRAAALFAEVCSALEYIHAQGLIHRDLKPSNIMVTPKGHAKVLDLGLALLRHEETGPREVVGGEHYIVGSMDYIAPEQTTNPLEVDARSDIYALGCTLYYALSGRPPFPGGTAREKMRRHRTEEPVALRQLRPELPPAFAALVRRLMAKDPQQRVASAAELRQLLLAWAPAEPQLPLDQREDLAYQNALTALHQQSASPAELASDWLPGEKDARPAAVNGPNTAAPEPPPPSEPSGLPKTPEEHAAASPACPWTSLFGPDAWQYFLLCLGLVSFWLLLLAVLGVLLLVQ